MVACLMVFVSVLAPTAALAAAPQNDDIAAVKTIASVPYSDTIDATDATSDPEDPQTCNNGKSVWYSFTPSETKRVVAHTAGSDYSNVIAVFRGEPDKDSLIACENGSSRYSFDAKSGVTYWFMVTGYSGGLLTFNLEIVIPPKNDEVGSAKNIGLDLPFKDVMNTTDASLNVKDPSCSGRARSVWYKLRRPERWDEKRVEINTFRSSYDTTLSIYTGRPGSLNQVECNDNAAGSSASKLRFVPEAGKTYLVMIGASGNSRGGRLVLRVKEPPMPFRFKMSVDPVGRVSEVTGSTKITGTMSCTRKTSVSLSVSLRQKIKDRIYSASDNKTVRCKGKETWSLTLVSQRPFRPGAAGLWADARAPREDRKRSKNRIITLESCSNCL
jgi:hypothetical protein